VSLLCSSLSFVAVTHEPCVDHHKGTPQYTLSILNKLDKTWNPGLWELVNSQLPRLRNPPCSNDGQVWRLQHYDGTKSASVELISSDKKQKFHFTLGTEDSRNSSRRNSRHSSSQHHGHDNHGSSNDHGHENHGKRNHYSNNDDLLNRLQSTTVFAAPQPIRPRRVPTSTYGEIRHISAEYPNRQGQPSTQPPDPNTQRFTSPLPRRSDSRNHHRQQDYNRGGYGQDYPREGYYYESPSHRGHKNRKKGDRKVIKKAKKIFNALRRKRGGGSESGDETRYNNTRNGNEYWRNGRWA
jgi:hypothetical protein